MKVSATTIQNSFGKYLREAMDGRKIYIEKNGKPVAVLKGMDEEDMFFLREEAAAYDVPKKYTYEEFLEITGEEESEKQYELIDGQIYLMPSPFFPHQVAVTEIIGQFYNFFKGKTCIPLSAPFDVKLHDENKTFEEDPNVVQPDMLVMCDPETINEKGAYDGRPTLVVEVLSKSSKSKDIMLKSNLYMKSGVAEYWVVDTENCQVTVYLFEKGKLNIHKLFSKNEIIKSYVFEGLQVDTRDVFV